jgi:HAMP domain-containing protein
MTPATPIRRRPLRVQLTRAFAVAGLLPFVILVVWGIAHGRQESARARRILVQAADHMRVELDEYLEHHRLAILSLASALEVAGRPTSRAGMETWLASVHQRYPGFVSMLATDSMGQVLAVTPPDVLGPGGGGDVSDRDYFQVFAWGHPRPFVSNAFRGRGTRSMPIVAVSAPVHDTGGRFTGIVEGSLDLEGLRRIEAAIGALQDVQVVVLDRDTTVVFGGGGHRFEPLTRLAGTSLLRAADGVVTTLRDSTTDGRRYAVVHETSPTTGWLVVVMQPYRVATAELTGYLVGLIVVAALAAFLIGVIAPRVAASATRPVEQLAAALRDFSPVDPPTRLAVPDDAPAEVGDLAESFAAMAQRTRRVITGLVPICAECKRIRNEQGKWEPVEQYVRAHSEAEFTHGLCPHCLERLGFPAPPPSPPDGIPLS